MRPTRRQLIAAGSSALAASLAGCNESGGNSLADSAGASDSESGADRRTASVEIAVAAEWNAMRARVRDALALGVAGDAGGGSAVAQATFARFEGATGEHGTHETLEGTDESNYEEFEEALGELRTEGLQAEDLSRAREEATIADTQLAEAQRTLVGEETARLLDLQLLGASVQDAAFLAAAGSFEAARTTAESASSRFEDAAVHDTLEAAEGDAYETFEEAVESVAAAAEDEDADAVRAAAADAYQAAIDGSYALADAEHAAGAGHVATLQARGWDAAALASTGGPSTAFAHAAALTVYRARAYDAQWLAARGETDRAATAVSDLFAHFEGARSHEALEEADPEAYEAFESGLAELQSAIESGDSDGIDAAVATVDANLVTGIEALAGTDAPLLEAAFFRARFADARELYRLGQNNVAASIGEDLFQRFEENELDVHETVESTSEELYTRFEDRHLTALIDAFENTNDSGVETHYDGVQSTLFEFETAAGTVATVSGAEGAYVAARGFDAAVLDALGKNDRARGIAQEAFEHFESGAGGYHEALEEADEEVYEAFEEQLGGIATAANDDEDVCPVAKAFNDEAVASMYAVVESSGGSRTEAAVTSVQEVFAHFEEARVHELLEESDRNAYETFEARLDAYIAALDEGGDVTAAAAAFADASQYAQFSLVDSAEELPLDLDLAGTADNSSDGTGGGDGSPQLDGGPNVVEGVPDDADHVIEMNAVAFEPEQLTVSQGDTVAWTHSAGEPHNVVAYTNGIPEAADYWASGGFESEEAARSGWENGEGAVQSGQSYVRTFETTGTHEYLCVPHEAAGMVGSVVVE